MTTIEPIDLFIIGSHWDDLPSMSPFGIKMATWMRLVDLPHNLEIEDDPRKGPKKKSPWIVEDGRVMGDTVLIIDYLSRKYGVDPDGHLSAREAALGHTLRRMFEEHYARYLEYLMFVTDVGWEQTKAHFNFIPGLVRPLVLEMIRKDSRKFQWLTGFGRHTAAEVDAMAIADLDAASTLLGDQPYFCGDACTQTDCSLYGFLSFTRWAPIPSAAQEALLARPNLVAFTDRMRERFWATASEASHLAA